MTRALAIAKADTPSLNPVKVHSDGSLKDIGPNDAFAAATILVNLLVLLVTFVGERMTLRMLFDVWPEASLDEVDSSVEEQS